MARRDSTKNRRPSLASKSGGSTESIFSYGSLEKLDHFGSSSSLPKCEYDSEEDGINVVVRIRPLNNKELKANDQIVTKFPGNGQILLEGLNVVSSVNGMKSKLFSFNVVFEPQATQRDVFNFCGIKRLVAMAVEGFNTTCFCYGQTGSGKTHTLTGPPGMFLQKKVDPFSQNHGLVYRSFLHLFEQLRDKTDVHFVLKASFLEIYNEKVIDLLNPGSSRKPLAVRWSKKSRNFVVENLFTVDCEELDDLQAVLEEGMRNRTTSAHNMNDFSGRGHTILTVHITSEQQMADSEVYITKHGKINFVDLAGSEMTKKTGSRGKTLEEANNINKSLMVLGYCIASLSDLRKRNGHIPYRDSKLTKLLSDSLAGTGVTLMIACISPALSSVHETLNTLGYAARAKRIHTKPIIVMDPRESLIIALTREVEALQNENHRLRVALDMNQSYVENMKKSSEIYAKLAKTSSPLNIDKLAQMDSIELVDLLKHYSVENEALRKENSELFHARDMLMRDHEIVCRENERLIKKLEANNTLSPATSRRTSHSADADFSSNTDPRATRSSASEHGDSARTFTKESSMLPSAIEKEMHKKRIGRVVTSIIDNLKTRKSADKKQPSERQPTEKYVTASVLYSIFGSPLYGISRSTSVENIAWGGNETWNKTKDSLVDHPSSSKTGTMKDDMHLPRIFHESPSLKVKRFRSPFGSPIPSLV